MKPRRVLILAHPFPPAGGGGVQRTTKLVKYLPRFGWTPTVLTTQADLYPRMFGVRDDTLLAEVPGDVRIVRVPSPELFPDPPNMSRVMRWLIRPERARLWNTPALPAALALHLASPFDVIYATGGPYSTFLLARTIARLTRRPYVADMRDAWLQWPKRKKGRWLSEARLARLERRMLLDAARVVFVTQPMEDVYLEAYPALRGRSQVIINGFDHDDFKERPRLGPRPGPKDPVEFLHAGTFNENITPDVILEAFRIARARDDAFRQRARFVFAGRLGATDAQRAHFLRLVEERGLGDGVQALGYIDHPRVLELQRTADALVLLTSGVPDAQHGKTAEYLAAGRPILALVASGTPADRMIAFAPRVERAKPDDPAGAADAFLALFRGADTARAPEILPPPRPELLQFSRLAATEQMAAVFSAVSSNARRGG